MPKGIPKNGINKGQFKKGQVSLRKGASVSAETKLKMRIAKLGKKVIFSDKHKENLSIALKGRIGPLKGQKRSHFSKEWRERMSKAKRFEDRSMLKKSDRQNSGAYYEWKKQVKNRDNNKCRMSSVDCGGKLEAHHIFNWIDYKELRYIISNGITLCRNHHPLKWEEEKRMIPIFTELVSTTQKYE